jgi:hypothetical protein
LDLPWVNPCCHWDGNGSVALDSFPSSPPVAARADLATLRMALDASPIPPKSLDRNLLIATWNVRAFGKVLPKWDSPAGDSPRRNLRGAAGRSSPTT